MTLKLFGCAATFAASLMLTTAPRAQEASPSHLAAARELIQTTHIMQSVDDLLPTYGEEIKRQIVTRPELTKDLDEVLKSLQPEMQLQRQQIINRAAQSYAKLMTEAEMKDTLAFFRTPSGAKFARIQPDLTDALLGLVQAWSQEVAEYVMVRTRAEMAKRGHNLQ